MKRHQADIGDASWWMSLFVAAGMSDLKVEHLMMQKYVVSIIFSNCAGLLQLISIRRLF